MKLKIYLLLFCHFLFIQHLTCETQLPKHIKSAKYCTVHFEARLFRESPVFKTVKKEIYHRQIKLNRKIEDNIVLESFVPSEFSHYLNKKKIQLFHYPMFLNKKLKALYTRFKEGSLHIRFNDNEKTLENYFISDQGVIWPKSQSYNYHFYKDGVGYNLQLTIKFIDFVYEGPRLEILKSLIPKNL